MFRKCLAKWAYVITVFLRKQTLLHISIVGTGYRLNSCRIPTWLTMAYVWLEYVDVIVIFASLQH